MSTMRAALHLEGSTELRLESITPIPPLPTDVVVRVTATAPCQTDVSIATGRKDYGSPLVCGHEACGVVEWTGTAVRGMRVGDRVVASSAPCCGRCWFCRNGHPNVCVESASVRETARVRRENGETATAVFGLGSFSDTMTVTEASLVKVETDLPDEQLALIGCGVTTGLGAVNVQTATMAGSTIGVIGCGTVGLAAVQGARIAGASTIIAVDPLAARRDLAGEFGATVVLDPSVDDVVSETQHRTEGRGVDAVIDAVGLSSTFSQAFHMTRRSGRVVLVGLPDPEPIPFDMWELFLSERRVSSALYGSVDIRRDIPRFVSLAETGQLDLDAFITSTMPLAAVNEALHALGSGSVLRTVLHP